MKDVKAITLESKRYTYSKGFCLIVGIYGCFLSFGYVLEKLMRFTTHKRIAYDYPIFLVTILSASNLLMSILLILFHEYYNKRIPQKSMLSALTPNVAVRLSISSVFLITAQITSTYALSHVGVPTQIIIKSAKMVPILIGGFFLFNKRYPWYDYFAVFSITISLIVFNWSSVMNSSRNSNTKIGIVFCLISLFCDGLIGPIQDDVLSKNDLHPYLLMFLGNAVALPLSAAVCLLTEGLAPIYTLVNNIELIKILIVLIATGSLGQLFIISSVKFYGSLYTGVITTLRKVFSTVLSVYLFDHKLTHIQWAAILTTFGTIFLQQFFRNRNKLKLK